MRRHLGWMVALLAAAHLGAASAEAGWIFRRSSFTHHPATGERVAQFAPKQTPYARNDLTFQQSVFRHHRSTIRVGESADRMHIVESWGGGDRIRPYGEWERPFRATDMGTWTYADPFGFEGNLCLVAYAEKGITLYQTRRDGLASCGSSGEGSFWTQPVSLSSEGLFLNADCTKGEISVEVLDEKGVVLEGFEAKRCRFSGEDSTGLPLRWGDQPLSRLHGRLVHLRFHLRNARAYSVSGK